MVVHLGKALARQGIHQEVGRSDFGKDRPAHQRGDSCRVGIGHVEGSLVEVVVVPFAPGQRYLDGAVIVVPKAYAYVSATWLGQG